MSGESPVPLPPGWAIASLPDIADLNPPADRSLSDDNAPVNFVPMRAVDPEGGGLVRPEVRTYGEVKKGYTSFVAGDVIMAKITPCMENGKTAVVPDLPGSVCFGSTEFHVARPSDGITPNWIAAYLLQHDVRRAAQRAMGGAVGQMRAPASFLEEMRIPVAPAAEQARIADALDELLSDLDAGVLALERVRAKLVQYRASVLKAAVDGTLTVDWRAEHPNTEPATTLLERILAERRRRWEEEQRRKFKDKGQEPPKNWKAKYKDPSLPDVASLSSLPEGWLWVTVDCLVVEPIVNGISVRGTDAPPGVAALRLNAMSDAGFDYSACRYLPLSEGEVDDLWVEAGDFFVCRGNGSKRLVGRGTLAQIPPGPIIFSDLMMRLRFDKALADTKFVRAIWSSRVIRDQIERAAKTTAGIYKIAQPDLGRITLPLPSPAEQQVLVEVVEDQVAVVDHLEADLDAKLKSAQGLRQAILRHAFSGQLVPQDPDDEPASELLKRIAADRESRARDGAVGKQRREPVRAQRSHVKRQV